MVGDPPDRVQRGKSSNMAQHGAIPRATFSTSAFVTARGLLLPKQVSFDKWVRIGSYLSNVFTSSAWCLGDWLVYGEAAFNGRYRDAIELTSLDYQTLRNHAWVARRFPMSRRRDALSFTHHAEVAALPEPERDFWLRKAEEHGWSVKRLRREVKASLLERATDNDQEPGKGDTVALPLGDTVLLEVPISADRLESCHAAASRLGLNLEKWAGQILAMAAAQVPDELLQQDLLPGDGPDDEFADAFAEGAAGDDRAWRVPMGDAVALAGVGGRQHGALVLAEADHGNDHGAQPGTDEVELSLL